MPQKHCDDHGELMRLTGEIHATVHAQSASLTALAEMQRDTQNRVRCLERKWWKSFGVVTGIVAFISLVSTGIGIYAASKRMEADYIKKDTVPVQVIVEEQNKAAEIKAVHN